VSAFLCKACGTEFPPSAVPPPTCPIYDDERQFVPPAGQAWTTHQALAAGHANTFRQHEAGTIAINTAPHFAIGQRAFLLLSEQGNVLWDCVSLLDHATVALIKSLGGLSALAISHPHFYTSMNRWSEAFDAPVYLHADDCQWVMNPGPNIVFWEGDRQPLQPGMEDHPLRRPFCRQQRVVPGRRRERPWRLVHRRHAPGDRRPATRHLHALVSKPHSALAGGGGAHRRAACKRPLRRLYAAFPERDIEAGAQEAVRRSAERYIRAVSGEGPADRERGVDASRSGSRPSTAA
jgi:hypothetical protein